MVGPGVLGGAEVPCGAGVGCTGEGVGTPGELDGGD